jgi:hypothetical protein
VYPHLLFLLPTQVEATRTSAAGIFLLAFSVNGLSPYLGLKTEFSFAMFSNQRYESMIAATTVG